MGKKIALSPCTGFGVETGSGIYLDMIWLCLWADVTWPEGEFLVRHGRAVSAYESVDLI